MREVFGVTFGLVIMAFCTIAVAILIETHEQRKRLDSLQEEKLRIEVQRLKTIDSTFKK